MSPSPYFELADEVALDRVLGGFKETARHAVAGPYGYVDASRMNKRTHDAIVIACYLAGVTARFTQGGLNGGLVEDSGNTHDLLDVADISVIGWSMEKQFEVVRYLDACGACGMIRGTDQDQINDGMVPHMHVVMYGAQHATQSCYDSLYSKSFGTGYGGAGLGGARWARWYGPTLKHFDREWKDSPYNPAKGWTP